MRVAVLFLRHGLHRITARVAVLLLPGTNYIGLLQGWLCCLAQVTKDLYKGDCVALAFDSGRNVPYGLQDGVPLQLQATATFAAVHALAVTATAAAQRAVLPLISLPPPPLSLLTL